MILDQLSDTAVKFSGLIWTILEHVFALFYIGLFVYAISKWLKFKKQKISYAIYIYIISALISFIVEIYLPIKFALLSIIGIFILWTIMSYYFYKESWKKSFLMALILSGLVIAVNILLGVMRAIFIVIRL